MLAIKPAATKPERAVVLGHATQRATRRIRCFEIELNCILAKRASLTAHMFTDSLRRRYKSASGKRRSSNVFLAASSDRISSAFRNGSPFVRTLLDLQT